MHALFAANHANNMLLFDALFKLLLMTSQRLMKKLVIIMKKKLVKTSFQSSSCWQPRSLGRPCRQCTKLLMGHLQRVVTGYVIKETKGKELVGSQTRRKLLGQLHKCGTWPGGITAAKGNALAGYQTQVNCLEVSFAHQYTTNAFGYFFR